MLLEGTDCTFGSVDTMVVGRDKLDAERVASNVPFDSFRAFVIHHVKNRLVVSS